MNADRSTPGRRWSPAGLAALAGRILYGLALLAVGIALSIGGARLLTLGGSAYYLPAGLAAASAGGLVLLRRWSLAAKIYLALVLISALWGLWESGLNSWALAPRVLSPAVLGLPFFVLALARGGRRERLACLGLAAVAVALTAAATLSSSYHPVPAAGDPQHTEVATLPTNDWPYFGGSPGGNHFTALDQITPRNVGDLKVAWSTVVGPAPRAKYMLNEAVPLKVGDHLYTCLPFGNVYELDPETGKMRWSFHAKSDTSGAYQAKCRGLAYYAVPKATGPCAQRLYATSTAGQLIGLDALTGLPCQGFGVDGVVDLLDGIKQRSHGYYAPTSAPMLTHGKVVVNSGVADGQYVGEPSGVIRAFDAVTGKLAWAWDLGAPGRHGAPPAGQYYTPGTPNSWAPMSADETLGLVYVPTGNSTPDYWGGYRSRESNQYSSSIVAIDVETGEPRWSFQTTHYDVWDYDVASQPILFELRTKAGTIPALLQPTKRGQVFVLDRRTGKTLFPVVEKPAPTSGAVERLSPTQPWSVGLPDLGGPPLTERSMWGLTALDQLWCRIKFREARYDGPLTPLNQGYSIVFPGYAGGQNWGSASIDEDRQLAFLLSNRMPTYDRLLPRSDPRAMQLKANPSNPLGGLAPQEGTPYAADIKFFLSPLYAPCQAPPWGLIHTVDLRTGKVLWSRPLGSGRDLGPLGMASHLPLTMGVFSTGGALGAQSGLVFVGASQDHAFRAFDSRTGKLLFEADLPGSAASIPISYRSGRSGRQFVIISSEAPRGRWPGYYGAVTAFALPDHAVAH